MKHSVIIPCYLLPDKDSELLGFTRNCINSLRQFNPENVEVIIVDNGSPVGVEYLTAVADVYIRNESNLGFAPAVNQGIRQAKGQFITVCNNDIEFINAWLDQASQAFSYRNKTGAVSSHLLSGKSDQGGPLIMDVPPGSMFGALWMTTPPVLGEVGLLDEAFAFGMYEDKDFWFRLKSLGFGLLKAGWCRHIGNATWGKLPNQHEIFFANKKRFEEKWTQ